MIPDTRNGLPAMACVSAMQKAIRRGMEREAMEFAVELMLTSKAFHSMVCKRLEIISHEDIDTQADPAIVPFVATAAAQAMKRYDAEKLGASRLAIGNAIRLMCRAQKSRAKSAISGLMILFDHLICAAREKANITKIGGVK
jgi:replication-associated recombination protein RarA